MEHFANHYAYEWMVYFANHYTYQWIVHFAILGRLIGEKLMHFAKVDNALQANI